MTSKIFNLKNLIWFCAIGLAIFSGYYSVFGISKLFSGGSWSIIGMAAMLELSKLVVITFLHDHFKTLKLLFKVYLMSAAVVLMIITSIGVYGYLTNSYQETAKIVYKAQNEMVLLDQKKELFIQQKAQLDKMVEEKSGRLKSLDNIRVSQQNAYTQQLTQKRGTGGLSRSMSSVDKTSENLNTEISSLTQKSFALSDSIAKIDQTKLTVSNETFSSELGPLLYLSRITGIPMDNVVNWFILILVIVFDPLAVSLVIAANHLGGKDKQKKILDELSNLGQELESPKEKQDFFQDKVLDEEHKEKDVPDVLDESSALDVVTIRSKNQKNDSVHIAQEKNEKTDNGDYLEQEPYIEISLGEIIDDVKDIRVDKKRRTKRLKKTKESSILKELSSSDDEQKKFYEELSSEDEKHQEPSPTYNLYKRGISV